MRNFYVIILLCLLPAVTFSQQNRNRWKAYRWQVTGGAGVSNFLGDLGGANQIGTHYFKDLEFSLTRLAISGTVSYKVHERIALASSISYIKVAGDDAKTEEFYRNFRNLNFKSNIIEGNFTVQGYLLKEQYGHRYVYRGVKGERGFEIGMYLFAGVGVFHFNPKGEYEDTWHKLHPLNTEGQGLAPSRDEYKLTQFCIPLGIGFKYTIDRRWGLGFEYGIRKTFTDYIDDVSKTYYDANALAQYNGDLAAALADKSDPKGIYSSNITGAGAQRGDPRYNDSYMFAVFSVTYKLKSGRVGYPIF